MIDTQSFRGICIRGFWGFLGATLVTLYPMVNWYEATFYGLPDEAVVLPTEWVWGGILFLAWLGGIIATAMEKEPHYLNCFVKGVGIPGIFVAAAGLTQLV